MDNRINKKIFLATGIFFPDVGGPAIHVNKIASRLTEEGFKVVVLAYGDYSLENKFPFQIRRISRKNHKLFQWALYLYWCLIYASRSALVYTFDLSAAGIPAYIASFIFRKPFMLRAGGDPIWERVVEKNKRYITIQEYYAQKMQLIDNPFLFKTIRLMLRGVKKLVVYNNFFKNFFVQYYKVDPDKVAIIKNPIFRREIGQIDVIGKEPIVVFAGRFVSYKNLPLVVKAFDNARKQLKKGKLLLIGHGPDKEKIIKLAGSLESSPYIFFKESLPQEKLFEEIRRSAVAIGPALNEFNPNFILESLSLGKPVLLSRGHGLSIDLPESFLFDAQDERELTQKIVSIFDPNNYVEAVNLVSSLPMDQTWENVTDHHLKLIVELIK